MLERRVELPVIDKVERMRAVRDVLVGHREHFRKTGGGSTRTPAFTTVQFAIEMLDAILGEDPSPKVELSTEAGTVEVDLGLQLPRGGK